MSLRPNEKRAESPHDARPGSDRDPLMINQVEASRVLPPVPVAFPHSPQEAGFMIGVLSEAVPPSSEDLCARLAQFFLTVSGRELVSFPAKQGWYGDGVQGQPHRGAGNTASHEIQAPTSSPTRETVLANRHAYPSARAIWASGGAPPWLRRPERRRRRG